ncbi:MAG: pitrilysin family protein [Neisseria sp.]|uniref:M16 family metallopeptidase n=1 Tax=Neisseria sp. TaxID=192066 RepID=UPI0026DD1985|nr:pitrilysin family protein [Neisseria sp.]MDO4640511.1 pitrilysin family protein [Neisseria sp.]
MNPLFLILVAAIIVAMPAFAAETLYSQGTLPNGLHYHILQTPNAGKRLELRLQVQAGTNDEAPEEKGGAHMLEHMAFRSSPEFPLGIAETLSRQGWQMGRHYNAQTAHEYTRYMLTPPKGRHQLDEALIVMKQFIQERNFKAEDWQQEQKIIQGENRTLQNLKERMAQQRTASLKNGSREARYRPIGDAASIDTMQVGTLSAFHKKWYAPNNATLVVISSLPAKSVRAALEKHLGSLPARALPTRLPEEYEPKLQHGWHIDQLQDKDNTESELNLIFRFPNTATRANTAQGEYERLLDNFAAYIINLRLQKQNLPPNVQQLTLRSGNLGSRTGFVGWLTQTTPDGHEEALRTLLTLRKSILAEPATDNEIAAYRRRFSELLRLSQKQSGFSDNPDELLPQIQDTLFNGKPLRTPAEHTAAVRPALYKISSRDVNERIRQWLNANDKLIQAQAPGLNPISLPPVGQLDRLSENPDALLAVPHPHKHTTPANVASRRTVPTTDAPTTDALFTAPAVTGKMTGGQYDAAAKTEIMQLENGDTAVVLQNPAAGDKTYLKIITQTGYLQNNLTAWQAHLAGEIIWKTPPKGLSATQFSLWKAQHKTQLDYQITPYHQIFTGNAPNAAFENLLQLYRAYQNPDRNDSRWRSLLQIEAARRPVFLDSVPGKQETAEFNLHYGRSEYEEPPANAEIASLSNEALLHQWQLLNKAPAAYYIVTSQAPQNLKPLIAQYLATIPRSPARNTVLQPVSGSIVQRIPIADDKHTDVSAWSWQPFYNWTPETSEQIPLLVNLANARLKNELRGRLQGTYSLKFTAQPDPEHNLVENQLYFRAEPQRAQELWQAAQRILQSMPEDISRNEAENLQRLFAEQEERRHQNPEVWLERLALSHQKYGDARYIRELPQLKYSIIQTRLRQTAKLLWSEPNAHILLTDPKP